LSGVILSAAQRVSVENTIIARKKLARKNFVGIRTLQFCLI
jgi:hypothetical protein